MDIQTIVSRNIRAIWRKAWNDPNSQIEAESSVKLRAAEEKAIFNCLNEAKREWQENLSKFDCVYEEKLVDYYIYRIKACEARYSYFLSKAKEIQK